MKTLFLHVLGPEGLSIYNGLELADGATVTDIITALDVHFIGKVNETYERFVFNRRDQKEGEHIEDYINCLRQLIRTCNFTNDISDSLLRDRLVLGIRSQVTRETLIQDSNLTLQTCIEKCRAAEATSIQLKVMGEEQGQANVVKHRKSRHEKKTEDKEDKEDERGRTHRECKYCGRKHQMRKEDCPAWGKVCGVCKKKNHFAIKRLQKKGKKQKVHVVSQEEYEYPSEDAEYPLSVGKEADKII